MLCEQPSQCNLQGWEARGHSTQRNIDALRFVAFLFDLKKRIRHAERRFFFIYFDDLSLRFKTLHLLEKNFLRITFLQFL